MVGEVLTPEEQELIEVLSDPVKFGKVFLNWEARWYQEEPLRDSITNNRIILRMGRRLGKTAMITIHMIWYAFTHPNATCLVATPFEAQITAIFREIRKHLDKSEFISSAVKRNTKSPETIEFHNGSVIAGFTAGTKSSGGAASIRGQKADWIYMDKLNTLRWKYGKSNAVRILFVYLCLVMNIAK